MIGDVYECRSVNQLAGQAGLFVFHYRVTAETGAGVTTAQAALVIENTHALAIKGAMAVEAEHRGTGVRKIFPLPIGAEASNTTGAGPGIVVGPALPKQVSGILTKRTATAGRSFRGRVYIPFPSEDDNTTAGTPTLAYGVRAAVLGTALLLPLNIVSVLPDPVGTATLSPVVWSRLTLSSTLITNFLWRPRWATQRRRGDYGRTNLPPF